MIEPTTPKLYIAMTFEDWVDFRWRIALEVLGIFTGANAEQAKAAVAILREADTKVTKEWRTSS